MRSRLLLIRHAEAVGNQERRFIGQSDVPLSPIGVEQAGALARRLAGLPISRVLSSDLERASSTAAPIAAACGADLETDARLREVANGEWTGLLPDEIAARWPDLWQRYRSGEDVARPGGETWTDVRHRVLEAVEELALSLGEGETMVVVSHAGPVLLMAHWAAGTEPVANVFRGRLGPMDNASISTVSFPGPRLNGFNDTGHLDPVALNPDGF